LDADVSIASLRHLAQSSGDGEDRLGVGPLLAEQAVGYHPGLDDDLDVADLPEPAPHAAGNHRAVRDGRELEQVAVGEFQRSLKAHHGRRRDRVAVLAVSAGAHASSLWWGGDATSAVRLHRGQYSDSDSAPQPRHGPAMTTIAPRPGRGCSRKPNSRLR